MWRKSFADIIAKWPRRPDGRGGKGLSPTHSFALDVGISYDHANMMRQRDSISPDYWTAVIVAGDRLGLKQKLTVELLMKLRERLIKRRAA